MMRVNWVAMILLCSWNPVVAQQKPNIVFVMIDDLGWMDLACQGNKLVETPNIDRLASQGMRFTSAYAAAPVCSPTRAAVLTGQSPARLRITNHIPDQKRFLPDNPTLLPATMLDHLPLTHTTLAERLKASGYRTAFLGKWHLSGPGRGEAKWGPEQQGFDLNVGGCGYGGPPTFFDPYRIPTIADQKPGEYLPHRLADEAIDFIGSEDGRPFLLFLWNYTVHWPMEAPQPLLEKYANRKGPGLNDTRYGAMIEAMDLAVGRVLQAIDQAGIADNTVIVFTSDNGGFDGVADNRPLRAAKGHLYEGGIRVPLIVRWPKMVPADTRCDTPVISMDFFPTLLEAAGEELTENQPLDGVSIMSLLKGGSELEREALYFHYPNYAFHRSNRLGSAIRKGRYKLVENFHDGSCELYDLSDDLGETNNLATARPELAQQLQRELATWRTSVNAALPRPVR